MKCGNIENGQPCQADLSPEDKFCPQCGTDIKGELVETEPSYKCPKCEHSIKEGSKFCTNCRWKVDPNILKGIPVPSTQPETSQATQRGAESQTDEQGQQQNQNSVPEDSLNGNTPSESTNRIPVPSTQPETSQATQRGAESQTDEQGQQQNQNSVPEDSLNGNTPSESTNRIPVPSTQPETSQATQRGAESQTDEQGQQQNSVPEDSLNGTTPSESTNRIPVPSTQPETSQATQRGAESQTDEQGQQQNQNSVPEDSLNGTTPSESTNRIPVPSTQPETSQATQRGAESQTDEQGQQQNQNSVPEDSLNGTTPSESTNRIPVPSTQPETSQATQRGAESQTDEQGQQQNQNSVPEDSLNGTTPSESTNKIPVPSTQPETSQATQRGAESQTDEQGQHQNSVPEDSLNGNTPSESTNKNTNDDASGNTDKVFGAGRQQEDNIQQSFNDNLASFNQGALSGQNDNSRFKDSAIFRNVWNKTPESYPSGDQENETADDNIDNPDNADNSDDELSDNSMTSSSTTTTVDMENLPSAKKKRPNKNTRDRRKRQQKSQNNTGKDQIGGTMKEDDQKTEEKKSSFDEKKDKDFKGIESSSSNQQSKQSDEPKLTNKDNKHTDGKMNKNDQNAEKKSSQQGEDKNQKDKANMVTSSKDGKQTGTTPKENKEEGSNLGKGDNNQMKEDVKKNENDGASNKTTDHEKETQSRNDVKKNENDGASSKTTNQSKMNNNSQQNGSQGTGKGDSFLLKTYAAAASRGLQSNTGENCVAMVTVYFHAIFSPSIIGNKKKDAAYILMESFDHHGQLNEENFKMDFDRDWKKGFQIYSVKLDVPWALIQSGCRYMYCVFKNGDSRKKIKEHVAHKRGLTEKGENRKLNIPDNFQKEVYHCYDGVVREYQNKANPKWYEYIKDKAKKKLEQYGFFEFYGKVLMEDAVTSIKAFHPKWQVTSFNADGLNGEEMINHIRFIVSGVRKVYAHTAGIWQYGDFDKVVAGFLKPMIEGKIKELNNRNTKNIDAEEQSLHFVSAVSIAYIVSEYEIILDQGCNTMLCEALLPRVDCKNKKLLDLDVLKKYFGMIKLRNVGNYVLKFSRQIARQETTSKKNPCWLFCVPLIHFLLERCCPFEVAEVNVDHANSIPKWWGIDMFEKDNDHFQEKAIPWERTIDEMFTKLEPYFKVDYLLPRSFLTTLNLNELEGCLAKCHFPLEAILATLVFYLKKSASESRPKIRKILLLVADQCIQEQLQLTLTYLNNIWRRYNIALDVFKESQRYNHTNTEIHIPAFEVFLVNLDLFDKTLDGLKEKNVDLKNMNFSDKHLSLYDSKQSDFLGWLSGQNFHDNRMKYLQIWDSAFNIRLKDGKIKYNFLKNMEDRLRAALQGMMNATYYIENAEGKIAEIYCKHFDEFNGKLQEILAVFAFKAVENSCTVDWMGFQDESHQKRYGRLLSDAFVKQAKEKKQSSSHEQLAFVMTFTPFTTFVDMHRHLGKFFTGDCQQMLTDFIKVLKNVLKELLDGSIIVSDLKCILQRGDNFQKIVSMVHDLNIEDVESALTLRQTEQEIFEKTKADVSKFVENCMRFQADVSGLKSKLRQWENIDQCRLNNIVNTITLDESQKRIEQYVPTIKVFDMSEKELEILPDINKSCQSLIFMKLWVKRGTELSEEKSHPLPVKEILQDVWMPTSEQYISLCQRLESGNIKFSEFDKFLKKTKIADIKHEFEVIASNRNDVWIGERLKQVENYRNLKNFKLGASAILNVVTEFELEGDFNQIKNILGLTEGTDTSMNTLDHSLLDTCSVLTEVTEEKANCLKTFVQCKPLVQWLRGSMSNGLKELKVFVDLASISAGEGAMEIDKVNCLHSATTGYAPLIFNLQKECDTEVFLEKCQEVWKELAADPKLPKKLVDTNRQLEWLKMVEKSHGSVEVSSLTQTEAINSRGVYKVGNVKGRKCIEKPCLSEVLELRITEEDEETLPRNYYTYEQLHDLQSRLMLVAGKAEKGKDDVDRFMLILDSVVRLGTIFTKLVADGCVLFTQWHVKFLCDRSRPACALLNFGYGENTHTVKGRVDNENEDVSSIIPKLAKFLEECHEKWLDFITQQRDKYFLLNFYTVDQMVILQQELVKVGRDKEPSHLVYPLLSAIKQGCTKENLLEAVKSAMSDVIVYDDSVEKNRKEREKPSKQVEELNGEQSCKEKEFLDYLTKAKYSLELAKKALQHVGADNKKQGIRWCIENEEDFGQDEQDQQKHVGSPAHNEEDSTPFSGWVQTEQSLVTVTAGLVGQLGIHSQERSTETLITDLTKLWDRFINSVTSSVSDYLSVEHLAFILNRLSEQEKNVVERSLLTCFKEGEPNLIVCPQSDIYNTVLSVYSHEEDRPLPQSDEVLLCTPQTTLDMLEIFWRRALFADNNKVHCLVNADLLDYDVSDRGEKSLERHMKNADSQGKMYKLIVICSSENEYKSRIVAALDKYHRPQLQTNVGSIRKYLQSKLKFNGTLTEIEPASSVDFERCSVRVVKSFRAGVGKTLFKKRMVSELGRLTTDLERQKSADVTIPLHEKSIPTDNIMNTFLHETLPPECQEPRIFHIDISHEVQDGVDTFLFQLLVLGCLGHSSGYVWRKSELDYYIIESMPLLGRDSDMQGEELKYIHHCLDILPEIICRSPQESLDILNGGKQPINYSPHDRLFDPEEFESDIFQRPYQYLMRLDSNRKLDDVDPRKPEGERNQCLETLLRHCGIQDPSWSELHHFVSFLNKQLRDFEISAFCGIAADEDLPGFAKFVLRFLIQMSRDFSTRSLHMSEESPLQLLKRQASEDEDGDEEDDMIELYQMRRTWETSPHPYLFFNPDQNTMTFLGFNIDKSTGNLIDLQTRRILEQNIMQKNLFDALIRNRVNLKENFDALPRAQKIEKLCNVMGQIFLHDPDETYELTTDNVKKMLAIYMRFRCDIPVIIMGETGCGKTRLIKFMCSLQKPPGARVRNMILMKVHGGTKASDIAKKVRIAEEISKKNAAEYGNMDTVLFFDEANTTEAIGVIKEVMCDKSLEGRPIKLHERLKIVAACNPYRKHSEELIKRLEQAGLGYHVDADKTTDRLGRVPMRRLVYRVQPLPQSMLPLVWDFGQLNTDVEELYIRQMVLRYINNNKLPNLHQLDTVTSRILTVSQQFMRDQKDECSFVSLRDVERVLEVMTWFYGQRDNGLLFQQMNAKFDEDRTEINERIEEEDDDEEDVEEVDIIRQIKRPLNDVTRSLVLALGVCYHACLKNRDEYRDTVARYFTYPLQLPGGADQIEEEISICQSVFLDNVDLANNIARNQALKENVFMMVVCVELRIPMFLVGKPGSSKSLAKTIVADAMQGNAAHKDLFKNYKQVQMVSFQCSPLSTPDGIVGTFKQCAAYQKDKDLDRFASVVVLDEIGLAEDSPRMPLKTLHPLLEDGCLDEDEKENKNGSSNVEESKHETLALSIEQNELDEPPEDEDQLNEPSCSDAEKKARDDEEKADDCLDIEKPMPHKKVAFIGISNWALDPAKMNRGIIVQREVPDETELINSANGVCSTDEDVLIILKPMFEPLAVSYLQLFKVSTEMREFFGLRDFYSLVKMLYAFVKKSGKKPTWPQLQHAVLRNFGGLENVEPVDVFYSNLSTFISRNQQSTVNDPDCTSAGMIQACIIGDNRTDSESRYLLLLTENYGALSILQQKIITMENVQVIFGSSFPSDQEYTQVCRNINRIKVCMETGSTVILLNLENLYESLYDALNQYYVRFGGEKYVDLGLGTHRVKCRVHEQFRLIVVAEKQIVYDKFPIPLINRLEKHFLSLKTMLTPSQLELADKLQKWAKDLCQDRTPAHYGQKKETKQIGDAFMGYHADTCAAIILHVCQEKRCNDEAIPQIENEILTEAQSVMLWCATPAAVWEQDIGIFSLYFRKQHHDSLADYLHYTLVEQQHQNLHAQITTHSKLLSTADLDDLSQFIPITRQNITLLTLQSFDTEQQFSRKIRSCLDQSNKTDILLIVQCDCGDQNADLIACARYTVQGELQQIQSNMHVHVVFLIQLPGIAGGCFTGFQCGLWHSVHIDDLHPSPDDIPAVVEMHGKSVSALLIQKDDTTDENNTVKDGEYREIDENNKNIVQPKRHFDINNLIQKCIQPALAKVKDTEKDSSRGTERLIIIHKLLQPSTGIAEKLLAGLSLHLTNILIEKEQTSSGQLSASWLSSETNKVENINKAGTFRRFAVQSLHSRVIPILAGVIAFIDTNRNCSILPKYPPQNWQVELWLNILNSSEVTMLKYENIVSPRRHTELQEFIVRSTSVEGNVFSAEMPFSWLIYRHIDDILKMTKASEEFKYTESGKHFEIVMEASEIFGKLPLGTILNDLAVESLDIIQLYLRDFVHMVYPAQTEEECKLLCEGIIIGCQQLLKGEFGRLIPSLFGCHMTYNLHAARFKNFSSMVNVWPECSRQVLTFHQNESMFLITDEEITLDVLALHLLVKTLDIEGDQLDTERGREKWLRQVYDYRPIVERILGLENLLGERCRRSIQETRCEWTRVIVLKLYIENMWTSIDRDIMQALRCTPLWLTLDTDADMKSIQTLDSMDRFLRSCNKKVVNKYFGKHVCVRCESALEGAPVTLPCDHIVCRKCFKELKAFQEYECALCYAQFPPDFDPDGTSDDRVNIRKYQDYRRKCNSFFMEVVSQLCFAKGTPPSEEVIQKLLSYITGHTRKEERVVSRELTIFDDSFDPTPVVRSFLLQQIMQTSGEEIDRYLETYFEHTSTLLGEEGQEHQLELCLLILQCFEDYLHQQNSRRTAIHGNLHSLENMSKNTEIIFVKDLLQHSSQQICSEELTILDKIKYIARTRFALSVVSKYIHYMYGSKQRKIKINANIREMFSAAAQLCDNCESPCPRQYFVKNLCRCYSIDSYYSVLTLKDVSFLNWTHLPQIDIEKVNNCFDRYIICGEGYVETREAIVELLLNQTDLKLADILQKSHNDWQTRIQLMLALHRKITMADVGEDGNISKEAQSFLENFMKNNEALITNMELTKDLLENSIWKSFLDRNISTEMDLSQQNITCLMVHFLILIKEIPGKTTLVTPLQTLALQPGNMVNSYIPTMPEDEVADVKEALLAARNDPKVKNPDSNIVFFRCPDGHPYVIGDCGRPYVEGNCNVCGKQIGGKSHVLRADNKQDDGVDRTETGHILDRATELAPIIVPERKLNRATFSILRLLTHMSMYVGADTDLQALSVLIKPNIEEVAIQNFLIEHIDYDLNMIQNALGINKDDALVLIHYILSQIMTLHTTAVISSFVPDEVCGLTSKKGRANWEENFVAKYITPVIQDMDNILKTWNERILFDRRLELDHLLQLLYETDKADQLQSIENLQEIPAVWRYKARISVDHLMQTLNTSNQKCPVLRLFLKEEYHLRAVRFVPSILQLQKLLIQKYNKKLDRAESNALKIEDVKSDLEQDGKLDEFKALLDDFIEAWECVRESLENYVCPSNETILTVNRDYCRTRITDSTPISYLLPTYTQSGLCSYVLLYFLLDKQNMFLQNYCQQSQLRLTDLPTVHVREISSAHLISYHPDKDLLPMVLANCNYSFEVGQGTRVEYNFASLERQLMDRFLFSKSIIEEIQEIETYIFRAESTNALVFKTLSHRIKQERISQSVQSQICSELSKKTFPDLCESLDKLDIAISFLKSVGSVPESFLYDFMTKTLKMDNPFPSNKAQQTCRCKHAMSWWITLALERTKRQAKYKQEVFEGLSHNLKVTLNEEQRNCIEEIINNLPLDRIDVLVALVFECIVLKIDIPQNRKDEDFIDLSTISFRDILLSYIETSPYESDTMADHVLLTAIGRLPGADNYENKVLTEQSVEFWKFINRLLSNKQQQHKI